MWQASYLPFGEVQSITGPATLDYRFPGQWFQIETGLHYNWHRHYDPSTGRYLQPDPIGMPDGPSRWAYVAGSPLMGIDRTGERISTGTVCIILPQLCGFPPPQPEPPPPAPPAQCTPPPMWWPWRYDPAPGSPLPMVKDDDGQGGAEHKNKARPSSKPKHEAGQTRKKRDWGGEKGDRGRRPPRKWPKGVPWPWPKK